MQKQKGNGIIQGNGQWGTQKNRQQCTVINGRTTANPEQGTERTKQAMEQNGRKWQWQRQNAQPAKTAIGRQGGRNKGKVAVTKWQCAENSDEWQAGGQAGQQVAGAGRIRTEQTK